MRTLSRVFDLVKPRMAGLWHTIVTPIGTPLIFEDLRKVYDGPVVQSQDLTVFNLTADAVVARQARVDAPPRARQAQVRAHAAPHTRPRLVGRRTHPARRRPRRAVVRPAWAG